MLVVIIIVLALTAAAIPVIMPALEGRRTREASRLLTSYMAGARDRALQAGRPMGVMLERFPGQPEMCITVSEVEVPPPYAGDTVNSRYAVELDNVLPPDGMDIASIPEGAVVVGTAILNATPLGVVNTNLIEPEDQIRFNYSAVTYTIAQVDHATGVLEVTTQVPARKQGGALIAPTLLWANGARVPFQILRQPTKTARPPVELPTGIVVDLIHSGDSSEPFLPIDFDSATSGVQDPTPVILLFGPTGSFMQVFHSELVGGTPHWEGHTPRGPTYLMLGQREKIIPIVDILANNLTAYNTPETNNLLDLTSRWISIQPSTGLIASSENAAVSGVLFSGDPDATREQALWIAREGQSSGGD